MNLYIDTLLRRVERESDISEHLLTLYAIATMSEVIVEFGVRNGNSTLALLAGQSTMQRPTRLFSYDIHDCSRIFQEIIPVGDQWVFTRANTASMKAIPECDVFFIDTLHTSEQVRAELKHASQVERFIILHDTVLFGVDGELGQPGILVAIHEFLQLHPEWRVLKKFNHNNGLWILEKK